MNLSRHLVIATIIGVTVGVGIGFFLPQNLLDSDRSGRSALESESAGRIVDFDEEHFQSLLAQGEPLIIHAHADWCAFCRAQEPTLISLSQQTELQGVHILRINYDRQRDALAQLSISNQSTLLAFHAGEEVDRLIGETDPQRIQRLFEISQSGTDS